MQDSSHFLFVFLTTLTLYFTGCLGGFNYSPQDVLTSLPSYRVLDFHRILQGVLEGTGIHAGHLPSPLADVGIEADGSQSAAARQPVAANVTAEIQATAKIAETVRLAPLEMIYRAPIQKTSRVAATKLRVVVLASSPAGYSSSRQDFSTLRASVAAAGAQFTVLGESMVANSGVAVELLSDFLDAKTEEWKEKAQYDSGVASHEEVIMVVRSGQQSIMQGSTKQILAALASYQHATHTDGRDYADADADGDGRVVVFGALKKCHPNPALVLAYPPNPAVGPASSAADATLCSAPGGLLPRFLDGDHFIGTASALRAMLAEVKEDIAVGAGYLMATAQMTLPDWLNRFVFRNPHRAVLVRRRHTRMKTPHTRREREGREREKAKNRDREHIERAEGETRTCWFQSRI